MTSMPARTNTDRRCRCYSLDLERLAARLERDSDGRFLTQRLLEPGLSFFAGTPVYLPRARSEAMARTIAAIESVVRLPVWRDTVTAWAPPTAALRPANPGVFLGYDFHLTLDGPRLIEINTNAGGAFLNAVLADAQKTCCPEIRDLSVGPVPLDSLQQRFLDMFLAEWRLVRHEAPLRTIVIVDDNPESQPLYGEFRMFQRLFAESGYQAHIVDPSALRFDGRRLLVGGEPVDLVYNRLTDFALLERRNEALRESWEQSAVVLTPQPDAHALYADKRNLTLLSDDALLASWGVDADTRAELARGVPPTRLVSPDNADELWAGRRSLFFKPASGYGSKAAYRGDKLTRGKWADILSGAAAYVAQEVVPPAEVGVDVDGRIETMKMDVRSYVYDGATLLLAARLYQGQTTNMRTLGGGFAPVYTQADDSNDSC